MNKIKLSYKGEEIDIYDSISPARHEDETHEEYALRKKVISDLEKAKRNSRNWVHISNVLVPAQNEAGKVLIDKETKKVKWIGVTKGTTYYKKDENTDTEESK